MEVDARGLLLGRGAGVTGYDEDDCLRLLARALAELGGDELPPVVTVVREPAVAEARARQSGTPHGAACGSRPSTTRGRSSADAPCCAKMAACPRPGTTCPQGW